LAEYWYDTTFNNSLGMIPFKVVYGRDPPTLTQYNSEVKDPPSLKEFLQQRDILLYQLKQNLERA